MYKILKLAYFSLVIGLLFLLSFATFYPLKNLYSSTAHILLWCCICCITLVFSIIQVKKKKILSFLSLILCIMILFIFFDKAYNQRIIVYLPEGDSVRFADIVNDTSQQYQKYLSLKKFITKKKDSETGKFFKSILKIGEKEKKLEINHPVVIGSYRLYQSDFETIPIFILKLDTLEFSLSIGDTLVFYEDQYILTDYNQQSKILNLQFNQKDYILKENYVQEISQRKTMACFHREKYLSGIEVVEVKGIKGLSILSVIYLIVLLIFFQEKKQNAD